MEPGTFSKPGVRGPGCGACERVSVGRGCGEKRKGDVAASTKKSLKGEAWAPLALPQWLSLGLGHPHSGPGCPETADLGPTWLCKYPSHTGVVLHFLFLLPTRPRTCVMVRVVLLTC